MNAQTLSLTILLPFSFFTQCADVAEIALPKPDPALAVAVASQQLIIACKTGNLDLFCDAITAGANPHWHDLTTHKTPLYIALKQKRTLLIPLLFAYGATFADLPPGESHFTRALQSQGYKLIAMLKDYGATPSTRSDVRQNDLKVVIRSGSFQLLHLAFQEDIVRPEDITDEVLAFALARAHPDYTHYARLPLQPSAEKMHTLLTKIQTDGYQKDKKLRSS